MLIVDLDLWPTQRDQLTSMEVCLVFRYNFERDSLLSALHDHGPICLEIISEDFGSNVTNLVLRCARNG